MSSSFSSVENVARRYAHRPGCRFLGAEEVGITVYLMDLRIIVIDARELPPIDEFLLRAVGLSIASPDSLSNFLGLDHRTIHNRLVELRRTELIDLDPAPTNSSEGVKCRLTARGLDAVDSLERAELREVTLPSVVFHGFMRRPLLMDEQQLLRPRDAQDRGILKIPSIPARRPNPDEIKLNDLVDVVRRHWLKKRKGRPPELVNVRSIVGSVRTRYQLAVLLQYELLGGKRQRQFAFAVDGVLDEGYEKAFVESKGPDRLPELINLEYKTTAELAADLMRPDLIKTLGPLRDIDDLHDQLDAADKRLEAKEIVLQAEARPDTRQILREELERERSEKQSLEEKLRERRIFRLNTSECRNLLVDSLTTAKERLVIVSAFLSSDVIDQEFLGLLEAALNRGVKVWIAYGIGDKAGRDQQVRQQSPNWPRAADDLNDVRKRHKKSFKLRDLKNTHEKILIRDSDFVVSGSYNWLSFRGGEGQRYRREDALRVIDPVIVREYFDEITKRFDIPDKLSKG